MAKNNKNFSFDFGPKSSDAVLSSDGVYRYTLSRVWDENKKTIGFICLNPSTADADEDDQTVRKCIRLAKKWGGGRLIIANLFAYRSTDPSMLKTASDPIGPENDAWIENVASSSDMLIAAWGTNGALLGRDLIVRERYSNSLQALRITKEGHPSHPLYLPETSMPFPFK